jgi:hypothetical protein
MHYKKEVPGQFQRVDPVIINQELYFLSYFSQIQM